MKSQSRDPEMKRVHSDLQFRTGHLKLLDTNRKFPVLTVQLFVDLQQLQARTASPLRRKQNLSSRTALITDVNGRRKLPYGDNCQQSVVLQSMSEEQLPHLVPVMLQVLQQSLHLELQQVGRIFTQRFTVFGAGGWGVQNLDQTAGTVSVNMEVVMRRKV